MGSMIGCPLPSFLVGAENSLYFILAQVLLLIPILILNFNYFISGFSKLFKGHPNMDTLVAVGSTASIVYGIFATVMIVIGLKNNDIEIKSLSDSDLLLDKIEEIVCDFNCFFFLCHCTNNYHIIISKLYVLALCVMQIFHNLICNN